MRKDFEDLMLDIAFGDGENYENEIVPLVDGEDTTQTREVKTGDSLNVLPLRNMVLFPGVLLPVTLSRPKSMKLVDKAYKSEETIGVFNAKTGEALYTKDVVSSKSSDSLCFSLYASSDLKYIAAGFNSDKSFRFGGNLYFFKKK